MAKLSLIKDLLQAQGLTLQKLADVVGIKNQSIQRIIKDNSTRIETLEKIATALNVPVAYFFPEEKKGLIFFSEEDMVNLKEQIAVAQLQEFEKHLDAYLLTMEGKYKLIGRLGVINLLLSWLELHKKVKQKDEIIEALINTQKTDKSK